MPSDAPARAIVMMSLSTVAGASLGTGPVPPGLEPDRVDRGVDLGLADDLLDHVRQRRCPS